MFERFPARSRKVLERARREAAVLGSQDLQAEHILLALTSDPDPVVAGVLAEAGLDREAVLRALDAQEEAALATVGVSRAAFGLPPARPLRREPGWATTSKQALVRAQRSAAARRDRSIRPAHLLLGVLHAEAGAVPRLLAFAGVDGVELTTRVEAALDRAGSPK
ncbi:MAG: Clp protease [Actinobacteria bacterium]|nr:Clp protease [Actinomycetota bacterium]